MMLSTAYRLWVEALTPSLDSSAFFFHKPQTHKAPTSTRNAGAKQVAPSTRAKYDFGGSIQADRVPGAVW
jgi:hypothetical protein